MSPQFDLEIFHHILNQFSENVSRDCSRIIIKLLKDLTDASVNDLVDFQNKKAYASVEVLLKLYEKLQQENKDGMHHSELPVRLIVNSILYLQQCSEKRCKIPDNDVQYTILSIISLLFKNTLLQNNSENLEDLVKFYDSHLMSVHNRELNTECTSDCCIFKLKILNVIYHALNTFASNNDEFQGMFKSIKNVDECKLFGDLVLCKNDDIAIQTLMCLIPEYINCFKSGRVVKVIWELISESVTDASVNYSRVLTVLCKIFDFCFEKSLVKGNVDLILLLLEDSNYWKLVQLALVEEDSLKRKQGLYLFKKTVHILNSSGKNIECSKDNVIFYWNVSCNDELYKIYGEIIIILEFLEEQQVHLIKPIFGMIETLSEKIIQCQNVSFSWIILVYRKALMHESIQIVKWGLISLLELPKDFFSNEYVINEIVELLVITLNNMNLYYTDSSEIIRVLEHFFNKVICLNTSKTFFNLFIKCLCQQVWSAETLFFVMHSLSCIGNYGGIKSFWGQKEISEIKEFVSKAFKTHNKIIRTGVQCELLKAISNLTDHRNVPLENLILLMSRLSLGEVMPFAGRAWNTFVDWLWNAYPEQEFKTVIEKYRRGDLEREFTEKCMSLIVILNYQVDENFVERPLIMNYFQEVLLSFKEIDKRLYCNKPLQDQYLSIVVHIYEANVNNCISGLIEYTIPFVSDIILYIQIQLQQISGLQDFNACQFYLNAFINIIKTLILFKSNHEFINDLYKKALKDLEVACVKSDTPPIEKYFKVKLLSVILELRPLKPESSFLDSYLPVKVNEPLEKDDDYSKQTRDSQTLWGRMNSEFLEGKWKILKRLINEKLIIYEPSNVGGAARISDDDLSKLCCSALNTGGYGVLCPVMSVLKDLLPALKNVSEIRNIVETVWKMISERRKTEEFKLFIKHFVEMLFQESLILMGDFAGEILLEYADFIFSDTSLAVINIFVKHIQQINVLDTSPTIFCHLLGRGLLFGPVQKKDDNLTNKLCARIEDLKICEARKIGDFNLSQEIRARAVQKILLLDKTRETHKTAARDLIRTLLKMENEINGNRIRYFGDSHTHRVKHRLMQALLLLEPILDPNEEQAIQLSKWLFDCLVGENSQPSVRYMQEWLLVRMIVRHSKVYSGFSIWNYQLNDVEVNKKSLCSLIAVTFHMCRLIHADLMEERILRELDGILPLCFHQHFEVRLYAQVVFLHLYKFSKGRKLDGVKKKFEYLYDVLENVFLSARKGNFAKNLVKLTQDFYLETFEPLEHYSLETLYLDLPRLTNAGPDEQISEAVFRRCGVDSYKMDIPLTSVDASLKCVSETERFMRKFVGDASKTSGEPKADEIFGNYQKKIIPMKPLIPGWDENSSEEKCNLRKDGLVVVASLIDRIPNLGGLARTCEIFGASEYVVNSLKYTEDKQFTSLSVTAEKWIPVKEVRSQNLLDYILEMKQNGYTVIGAEQALYSLPLSAVKFPKKSLLLLGNEKEGIPPNLLPLLDICVEIPQVGIIRSLNVHVTGALFIWEYAKQFHFS